MEKPRKIINKWISPDEYLRTHSNTWCLLEVMNPIAFDPPYCTAFCDGVAFWDYGYRYGEYVIKDFKAVMFLSLAHREEKHGN